MPRKSVAALTTLPILKPVRNPDPPPTLTPAQAALWKSILCSKQPQWWDQGNLHLLSALVRHITAYEALCAQIERFDFADPEHLETLNRLTLMRDRECKLMMALTVKMRLSQQSVYEPERAKHIAMRGGRTRPPWEFPNPFEGNGRRIGGDD